MSDSGEGVDPILQKGSTTWCRGVSQERKETFEEMTSIFCETNYTTLAQGFAAWGDSAEVDIESNISPISKTRESLECSLSHMCSSESYSFEKNCQIDIDNNDKGEKIDKSCGRPNKSPVEDKKRCKRVRRFKNKKK